MKKEVLENINSELFNSFNPEDELWIIGGYTNTCMATGTHTAANSDFDAQTELDWDTLEEAGAQ